MHSTVAVRLVLCALLGLLAALIDLIAVVGRRGALAGVPLLVVFTVSGAVPREPVSWVWFVFAAARVPDPAGPRRERRAAALGASHRSASGPAGRRCPLPISAQRVGAVAVALAVLLPLRRSRPAAQSDRRRVPRPRQRLGLGRVRGRRRDQPVREPQGPAEPRQAGRRLTVQVHSRDRRPAAVLPALQRARRLHRLGLAGRATTATPHTVDGRLRHRPADDRADQQASTPRRSRSVGCPATRRCSRVPTGSPASTTTHLEPAGPAAARAGTCRRRRFLHRDLRRATPDGRGPQRSRSATSRPT